MSELLIKGGLVLATGGPIEADVLVRDGEVAEIATTIDATNVDVVDAAGCWVGPGLVDVHSHLREPGQEYKEDIASGSAAASAGGYTAIVAMPNTAPAIDSGHLARYVADRGREVGIVEVVPSGTITEARAGQKLAHLDELWAAGVRMFSDDGDSVADAGLLRRAMEYVAQLGGVIAQHAIDPGLAANGHMNEGVVSSRMGMQGIPALAEETVLARDLALVRLTGVRYHAQHVSTAGSVALIGAAKSEGLPITAEVTPHHLTFTDEEVRSMDPVFKMMPPLRTAEDVAALRAGLVEGVIDCVATDHAPHAAHEKDTTFEDAPFGVIGLEWAAGAVTTAVDLNIERFFDRMSTAPARIAGIDDRHGLELAVGRPANLVVFDPVAEAEATTTRSQATNSPYLGRSWRGVVRTTIYRGAVTHASVGVGR